MSADLPELIPEPEAPKIYELFESLDYSSKVLETSTREFIRTGSSDTREEITTNLGVQAHRINKAVKTLIFSDELNQDEKNKHIAFLVSYDDCRRVDFLNILCNPNDEDKFTYAYSNDITELSEQVNSVITNSPDRQMAVNSIIESHISYIETDFNHFLESSIVQNKLLENEKYQKLKDRIIRIGETTFAIGVGTIVGNLIINKFKK